MKAEKQRVRVVQGQLKAEVKLESQVAAEREREVGLLTVVAQPEMGPWQNLEAEVAVEEKEEVGLLMVVALQEVALLQAPEIEGAIPVPPSEYLPSVLLSMVPIRRRRCLRRPSKE